MHTVVFALSPHSDIAKFEVEDGLARGVAAELLAVPSSITRVSVDIATSGVVDFESPHEAPAFDALFTITASSMSDAQPANLDDMVASVASVVGAWSVTTVVVAERKDHWIGVATPGMKLVVLLTNGPGIDGGSYDGWLRDALQTCADELDGVGVTQHTPIETLVGERVFQTMIEFSFPTRVGLVQALETQALQAILGSDLLDADKTLVFTSVEHLLEPNENAWEMHDSAHRPPDE